jgi:probable addiction module antidote protein
MEMNKIKTRPFDMANYLHDEHDVTEYLRQVLEDGDPTELAAALGAIARARGMTQLAKDTGLSRESLYRSLSGERAPNSDTLFKVLKALGLKLSIQAETPSIPKSA